MRLKICCIASAEEAALAAEVGAALIGLVGPMPSGAGVQTAETCRQIAVSAPAWVTPVLLTSSETAEAIADEVRFSNVRAVQLVRHVAPQVHDTLAETLPWVRRIQVIHVEDRDAFDLVDLYDTRPDAYLLDSGRPSSQELGGTGRTHDWQVSTTFVRRAPRPVFLAGGLTPENITTALQQVRPFGLDVCSGVRTGDRLDRQKLQAFVSAVREAA